MAGCTLTTTLLSRTTEVKIDKKPTLPTPVADDIGRNGRARRAAPTLEIAVSDDLRCVMT